MESHCTILIWSIHNKRVVFVSNSLLTIDTLVNMTGHLVHCVALLLDYLLDHVLIDHMVSLSHGSRPFISDDIDHFEVVSLLQPFLEIVSHISIHALHHYLTYIESVTALLKSESAQRMECLSLGSSEHLLQGNSNHALAMLLFSGFVSLMMP